MRKVPYPAQRKFREYSGNIMEFKIYKNSCDCGTFLKREILNANREKRGVST